MTDQQNAALELCRCPVPWCGGAGRYEDTYELEDGRISLELYTRVVCMRCGLKGPLCDHPLRALAAWNTRPAPAGAEAVREALTGCMAALKSARSWFETIAEAPEDEADGFVEEAKNVVDAAYFNADCALDALTAAKAPSTGEVNAGANEIRHLKQQIRQMFITIDKQAAALATPQPAPTAAEDGLREAVDLKRILSTLEGAIVMANRHKDTFKCSCLGWLEYAKESAEQIRAALRAKPTAAEDGLREALLQIRETCGKVCEGFETCTHVACQSSYNAWAIADQALRAKPTAAEDGLREALEAKIASLEASIKGKEAIIYGLLTKGTNQ